MIKNTNKKALISYIFVAIYWFSFYSYGSTLPTHAYNIGANDAMIGLIVGSYGFAQMIFRIPVGLLSDRYNKKKLFIGIGIILSTISALGLGFSKTPELLLLFRTISGIAVASWVVFLGYFTNTLKENDLHKITGRLSAFGKSGRMIAIILGSLIAFLINGYWSFFIGGIMGFIGILVWIKMPKDLPQKNENKIRIKELFGVIKNKDLLISSFLTALFQFAVFATVYSFIPIYAKTLGLNDFLIGILTAVFTLTGIISALLSSIYFKKHLGVRNTVIIAFFISGIIYLSMPHITSIVLLFIAQLFSGFFMGLVLPMLMAQSLKTIEDNKVSTAMGFFQAIYGLGMFFGPYVVGIVIEKSTIKSGFLLVFTICLLASLLTYIYKRSDKWILQ